MSNKIFSRDGLFRPRYTFLVAGGVPYNAGGSYLTTSYLTPPGRPRHISGMHHVYIQSAQFKREIFLWIEFASCSYLDLCSNVSGVLIYGIECPVSVCKAHLNSWCSDICNLLQAASAASIDAGNGINAQPKPMGTCYRTTKRISKVIYPFLVFQTNTIEKNERT